MNNRLAGETSPYLLQHAENPVHWQPWDDAALADARESGKPILLSIGYSSCHWCHVMAHESFEDPATAAVMNAHFVNVKVDREGTPGPGQGLPGRASAPDPADRWLAPDPVSRSPVPAFPSSPEPTSPGLGPLSATGLRRPAAARSRGVRQPARRPRGAGPPADGGDEPARPARR